MIYQYLLHVNFEWMTKVSFYVNLFVMKIVKTLSKMWLKFAHLHVKSGGGSTHFFSDAYLLILHYMYVINTHLNNNTIGIYNPLYLYFLGGQKANPMLNLQIYHKLKRK